MAGAPDPPLLEPECVLPALPMLRWVLSAMRLALPAEDFAKAAKADAPEPATQDG